MANTILIRRKTTVGAPPVADLTIGEGVLVIPEDTIYYKKNATTLVTFPSGTALLNNAALTGTPTSVTPPLADNTTAIATTAFVQALLVNLGAGDMLKSQYDSNDDGKVDAADDADSLGGVAASDYALTTYVDTAISDLIQSAPGALDTLQEIASALGDDPNFATTITTLLGQKLDSDSIIDGGTIA